jgi:hypothetical protein
MRWSIGCRKPFALSPIRQVHSGLGHGTSRTWLPVLMPGKHDRRVLGRDGAGDYNVALAVVWGEVGLGITRRPCVGKLREMSCLLLPPACGSAV